HAEDVDVAVRAPGRGGRATRRSAEPGGRRPRVGHRRLSPDPAVGPGGCGRARRALLHVHGGRRPLRRRPRTRAPRDLRARGRGDAPARPFRGQESRDRAAAAPEPDRVLRETPAPVGRRPAALPAAQREGGRLMRIAIDARKLQDFGIGTYIRNLVTDLDKTDHDTEHLVLGRPADVEQGWPLGGNLRTIAEPARPYSLAEEVRIPWRLQREHVHLVHERHYVLPPAIRCRSVVTIHDCIHLMFPQYLPNRLAHLYARHSMGSATRKA